jgi:23S rRNA pseudouridine1911/1915/1917 synthase
MIESGETLCLLATEKDQGIRLDIWIASHIPEWSRTRIQDLIRDGHVESANRTDWRPRDGVIAGEVYCITPPMAEPVALAAEDIPLEVLHEDRDLIVINKPAGLVVHPAPGHSRGTLVNALLYHCRDLQGVGGELRPGIVHRLDKDTSGVMVVAKNQQTMDALASQFQNREVLKEYLAVVAGIPHPSAGRIETEIGRSRYDRKKMSTDTSGGKQAVTNYRLEEVLGAFSLVRLHIETGRTHQIRVQMAHIGCPVAGDDVYGGPARRLWTGPVACARQMLHAESLSFVHPATGIRVAFKAPLPADMAGFIIAMRQSPPRRTP